MDVKRQAPTVSTAPQTRPGAVASYPLDSRGLALVLFSTLLWSSNSIAVKFGLMGLSPYTLMATRTALAASILLGVVFWRRIPFAGTLRAWVGAISIGVLQLAVAGTLSMWALQYVTVSRATILGSVQPFLIVVAAHFLFPGERLTARRVVGLTVGFAGVVVVTLNRSGGAGGESLLADVALVLGAAFATTGNLLVKWLGYRWRALPLVAVQMTAAAVVMAIGAAFFDRDTALNLTAQSVGGLLYLATVGSGGAFFLGNYVIRRYEVSVISSFVFLQPVFGVLLGAAILGEQITWITVFSLVLIAVGITIVNRTRKRRAIRTE